MYAVVTVNHCHCVDVVGDVMNNLSMPRSRKKLVDKIMELGLVADRKDLRRKRQRKDGSVGGAQNKKKKKQDDFSELVDIVSDEHSSSESTFYLQSERASICTSLIAAVVTT